MPKVLLLDEQVQRRSNEGWILKSTCGNSTVQQQLMLKVDVGFEFLA